jgi:histone acetyltransferase (RNA polymerase elongator complex component)
MRNKIIPIFIPHEGCPHDCSFCNQKKISGSVKVPGEEEIQNTIQMYVDSNDESSKFTIAYYGGSFTAIEEEKQIALLQLAKTNMENGKIHGIRVSTRPDYLNEENVRLLKSYSVEHVEIGIQSTDPVVLRLANRHYDLDGIKEAVQNLKKSEINWGFQIMVGLPGDNRRKLLKTTFDLLHLKPSTLRIYPCLVIKDTQLEQSYYEGSYKPLSLQEAVDLVKIPFTAFTEKEIPIIRTGLHASKSLGESGNVIAGPNHPSFGEIVVSSIIFDMICGYLDAQEFAGNIIIGCSAKMRSKVSGNKNFVLCKLKDRYGVDILIQSDDNLENMISIKSIHNDVKLSLGNYYKEMVKEYESEYNISR